MGVRRHERTAERRLTGPRASMLIRRALYPIVRGAYNRSIRPRLPRDLGVMVGVVGPYARWLDLSKDRTSPHKETHAKLASENASAGDEVVVIGGGWGISTVHAALQGAEVHVYEAAREQAELLEQVIQLNHVADRVTVEHAVVGPEIDVWGSSEGAVRYRPDDLPECDVLEIDAEGAEVSILEQATHQPRTIIVEYHPQFGAPSGRVARLLDGLGDWEDVASYPSDNGEVGILVANRADSQP